MTCNETRSELSAFMDGELVPSEARAVEGHLAGCESCVSELAALRWLSTELAVSLPADPSFLVRFRARRDQVLEERNAWVPWRRLALRLGPVTVAAAITVVLGVWLSWEREALADLEASALGNSIVTMDESLVREPVLQIALAPFPDEVP